MTFRFDPDQYERAREEGTSLFGAHCRGPGRRDHSFALQYATLPEASASRLVYFCLLVCTGKTPEHALAEAYESDQRTTPQTLTNPTQTEEEKR